jgi:hypothetical protein
MIEQKKIESSIEFKSSTELYYDSVIKMIIENNDNNSNSNN